MWPFTRKPIDGDELKLTLAILNNARDVFPYFEAVRKYQNGDVFCAAIVNKHRDKLCVGFGDSMFFALRSLKLRVDQLAAGLLLSRDRRISLPPPKAS